MRKKFTKVKHFHTLNDLILKCNMADVSEYSKLSWCTFWEVGAKDYFIYTVSQKNVSDVAHYNFKAHQLILVIFGRDIAEWICY